MVWLMSYPVVGFLLGSGFVLKTGAFTSFRGKLSLLASFTLLWPLMLLNFYTRHRFHQKHRDAFDRASRHRHLGDI